jgi:DNA-binding transcriptional LysR family regulator
MEWSERIGRRIKLRDLHILLAVVQCKSMAKAAEQLAVSKPVVSKVIADLERTLGVRVLERGRHGAEPTIYGAALLRRGVAVFDELREGVKDIQSLVDPTAGEIRIGCSPLLATTFVSLVVERLSRRWPRIVFRVVARQAQELHHALSERNVDLLVARKLGALADPRFDFDPLFEDHDVIVAGVRNPLLRHRRIRLAALAKESWVLPPSDRDTVGAGVLKFFRSRGLGYPHAAVVSDSPHVRMGLVAGGRFISIVPAFALRFHTKQTGIRVLPVELPRFSTPVGLVVLKNRTLSPVARLFIEHARDVAGCPAKQTEHRSKKS